MCLHINHQFPDFSQSLKQRLIDGISVGVTVSDSFILNYILADLVRKNLE